MSDFSTSRAVGEEQAERLDADELIAWALKRYGRRLVVTTSFGPGGIVLLHKLLPLAPRPPVLFINTGRHFGETLELKERLRREWRLEVVEITPPGAAETGLESLGERPWEVDPDLCCHFNKVKPLLERIDGDQVWMSAIRREQTATRGRVAAVERDQRGVLKVSPLRTWTSEQVWGYIRRHGLPYNRLHDQGYRSIGCRPCTTPSREGEGERAGRWRHRGKSECGLHLALSAREERFDPTRPNGVDRKYPNEILLAYRARRLREEEGPVLEVGCGTGTDLAWLAGEGLTPCGTEVNRRSLAAARAKLEALGVKGELAQRSLTGRLPFAAGHFVFAYSFTGPLYLSDREQAREFITEIARVLAPGKTFLGLFPAKEHFFLQGAEALGESTYRPLPGRVTPVGYQVYVPRGEEELVELFGGLFEVTLGRHETGFDRERLARFHVVTARRI